MTTKKNKKKARAPRPSEQRVYPRDSAGPLSIEYKEIGGGIVCFVRRFDYAVSGVGQTEAFALEAAKQQIRQDVYRGLGAQGAKNAMHTSGDWPLKHGKYATRK